MRKLHLVLLLPVLAVLPALWEPARAQGPIQPQLLYYRQRQINIPFDPDPSEAHRLKQLQLYYSTDQGRTWHPGATAAPEHRKFSFNADSDGVYLFAVQTTDLTGRKYPDKMDGATAGLRVVIDTVAPVVNLKALAPSGNQVGVAWDIRDDNFDQTRPDALRLEYRVAGGASWLPLYPARGANQHYWTPGSTAAFEARLRATDLAGNATEATTQVSLNNQGGFGNQGFNTGGQVQQGGVAADPDRRFMPTKRIQLHYEITEKGASGISGIDLWSTTDGRGWTKFQLAKDAFADATFNRGPVTFEVPSEGVYGFTLVPKSGVGISAVPPQVGEKPQIWIEVDMQKPVVELQSVLVGQGNVKGQLSITWNATDKNFGEKPITLAYAGVQKEPWVTIAKELPNTGRFVWTMPTDVPWQFYLKVEAIDRAGNIGEAITPGLVKVDNIQPKAKILNVQPGG